ncbi:MAG: P-loop NTPase [Deltaproteobacteria bacterium]|nr:P-loop NTPase [Deltaproteobacteria bacterium]
MDPLELEIRDKFKQISFGEEGSNVLESNIVHSLEIDGGTAEAVLIIEKQYESLIDKTTKQVEEALKSINGIKQVGIKVINADEMKEALSDQDPRPAQFPDPEAPQRVNYLSEYKNIILVASGKGGVGKSTMSVNLALALKHLGKTVSLLDADVYGPSIPVMLGARNKYPKVIGHKILPLSCFGMEFMSMGNLIPEDQSMIWRGPMIHQAIEQLLRDTSWPGGDYMIVDLPPGTGDVQISLAQTTEAAGAVIVCTPQDVALLDARKALNMFDKVNIPILGMIENMSYFICPDCGSETPIFSKGGTEEESKTREVPFLGRVPIELDIRLGGDNGVPILHSDPESQSAKTIIGIARKIDEIIEAEDE